MRGGSEDGGGRGGPRRLLKSLRRRLCELQLQRTPAGWAQYDDDNSPLLVAAGPGLSQAPELEDLAVDHELHSRSRTMDHEHHDAVEHERHDVAGHERHDTVGHEHRRRSRPTAHAHAAAEAAQEEGDQLAEVEAARRRPLRGNSSGERRLGKWEGDWGGRKASGGRPLGKGEGDWGTATGRPVSPHNDRPASIRIDSRRTESRRTNGAMKPPWSTGATAEPAPPSPLPGAPAGPPRPPPPARRGLG